MEAQTNRRGDFFSSGIEAVDAICIVRARTLASYTPTALGESNQTGDYKFTLLWEYEPGIFSGSGIFTLPADGIYLFDATLGISTPGDNGGIRFVIHGGGTYIIAETRLKNFFGFIARGWDEAVGPIVYQHLPLTGLAMLNAGVTVTCKWIRGGSTGTTTIPRGSDLNIYLIPHQI